MYGRGAGEDGLNPIPQTRGGKRGEGELVLKLQTNMRRRLKKVF